MGNLYLLQAETQSWTEMGRVGLTVISLLINLLLGGLTTWVLAKSKTTDILRGEKEAWREKAERLDDSLKEQKTEISAKDIELAELRTKTDLKPVLERLKLMIKTFHDFENKNNEVHSAMITSLQANTSAIQQTAETLRNHFAEDKQLFEDLKALVKPTK